MSFRLDPEIRERVARAATITGQKKLIDFAPTIPSEKADEVLERPESPLLTCEDYRFVLTTLEDDWETSDRSREAAERYRRGRRERGRYCLTD